MTVQSSALPQPNDLKESHRQQVENYLKSQIAASSEHAIAFDEFMKIVLYQPQLGYYATDQTKFGIGGDFITAPEISALFGGTLALEFSNILKDCNDYHILEFGAGTAKLAADIMQTLKMHACLPKHYYILEISAELKHRQQKFLKETVPDLYEHFIWLDKLPKSFTGIILANEVLDAMPCKRFCYSETGLEELFVTFDEKSKQFKWQTKPATKLLRDFWQKLNITPSPPYYSEININNWAWINSLGNSLSEGVIFLIDYGYPRQEYYHPQRNQGTLKCFFEHHQHDDPLCLVGIQDITTHVDFTLIAEAAVNAELEIEGYTTQANFLLNAGISKQLEEMQKEHALASAINLNQQVKKLTLPSEMGELFKVMALSKNYLHHLNGFQNFDRLHTL